MVFADEAEAFRLAERSRPSTLERYIGQADIVGPGSLLRARIEAGEGVGSCILWGPPGCGKTCVPSSDEILLLLESQTTQD
jgi:putative ATPase